MVTVNSLDFATQFPAWLELVRQGGSRSSLSRMVRTSLSLGLG